MNDAQFKRHLKDLVHGHHHPEEHDWAPDTVTASTKARTATPKKRARTTKAKKK